MDLPLWDTALSGLNAKGCLPAGRDLIGPYVSALRERGLKAGLYFSHLDWSHPDYPSLMPTGRDPATHTNPHAFPPNGIDKPEVWERFMIFHRGQLRELCERYNPDLLWFDGDWERSAEQWRFEELRGLLHTWAPNVILNSRMGGYGDYLTPEQAIPIQRPEGPWEFNVTINDSWGYQKKDTNFKTVRQCVRMLAECAGMGGNLLPDIGPTNQGTILPEQADVLRGLGRWVRKHSEAIYGTVAGLPHGHFYGPTTSNKAGDVLYLFCFDRPRDAVAVKGIRNKVLRASIVQGSEVKHRKIGGAPWMGLPGVLWVDVPEEALDQDATVIKLELDGPLQLYSGSGHAVTAN